MDANFELKLRTLLKRVNRLNIDLSELPAFKKYEKIKSYSYYKKYFIILICCIIVLIFLTYFIFIAMVTDSEEECYIYMPGVLSNAFRAPQLCDFCANITEIVKVANISPENFEKLYAYNAAPIIVTDATVNWTALNVFNFWYFKDIYEEARKTSNQKMNCQFFPYKSGFATFYEALNIPKERVNYEEGTDPWYFGWSNCNHDVAEILRQHYDRPYFLPKTAENAATDWIFMGGQGLGAHMHVDNVRLPSWQAQIKGSKKWILAPPPECYYQCTFLETTVKTGEISNVVLDTNRWYHKTNVMPGELSITIGAEYD